MSMHQMYSPQRRKRVKTENSSLRESLVTSKPYSNQYQKQQSDRLPNIHRQNKTNSRDLNMINQQDKGQSNRQTKQSKRNGLSLPYYRKKQIQKVQKIYDLLCNSHIQSEQIIINLKPQNKQQLFQKYNKVSEYYSELKENKKSKDVQQIFNFINVLKGINKIFAKIDDVLSMILIKRGKIHEYEENSYVYHQNQPRNQFMIVLWGEVKIKEVYRNKVKFCIPGDMLCEQIIVQNRKNPKKYFSDIGFIKGNLITNEKAKAQCKCGLLSLTKQIFQEVKLRFIQNGQKDKIHIFQRLIEVSLAKKARLRK